MYTLTSGSDKTSYVQLVTPFLQIVIGGILLKCVNSLNMYIDSSAVLSALWVDVLIVLV